MLPTSAMTRRTAPTWTPRFDEGVDWIAACHSCSEPEDVIEVKAIVGVARW